MDEQLLLQQIANGDSAAFKALYERFSSRVYNTSLSYLQNTEEAEETTQDVFVEIHRSVKTFESRSSLSTWIYRLTVNKCLDKLKHRKRQKRSAQVLRIFGIGGEIVHDVATFDHPGILLEQKENARLLFEAIDELPAQQKTAYLLSNVENLSGKEIAESLLQRAKANLRKSLSGLDIH